MSLWYGGVASVAHLDTHKQLISFLDGSYLCMHVQASRKCALDSPFCSTQATRDPSFVSRLGEDRYIKLQRGKKRGKKERERERDHRGDASYAFLNPAREPLRRKYAPRSCIVATHLPLPPYVPQEHAADHAGRNSDATDDGNPHETFLGHLVVNHGAQICRL